MDSSLLLYGADPEGNSDTVDAFEAAFRAGEKRLFLPAGRYLLGRTLYLPSGTHLTLDEKALVFAAPGTFTGKAVVMNTEPVKGNNDISITGGTWDGRCDKNIRASYYDSERIGLFFAFSRVNGLHLENLRLRDASSYHIRLGEVTDFTIEHIRFEGELTPLCQDGIHIGGGCHDGTLRFISAREGSMGDDLIALNADDCFWYGMNQDMKPLPIHHITVEHVDAPNCYTGIRLLSVTQEIADVVFRDITIGYRVHGINLDAARHAGDPIFLASQYPDGVGNIRRILFEDIRIWNAGSADPNREAITWESNVRNVTFRRLLRIRERDAHPTTAPTFRLQYLTETDWINGQDCRRLLPEEPFISDADAYPELVIHAVSPLPRPLAMS